MKTKLYSALAVTFLSVILFSCKSVNKLYQKGDYDEAVLTAVKKIQKNKLKDETKQLITDAYAKAIAQRIQNIHSLELRNDELKWEAIAGEYEKMQKLTDAINRSEEALQYVTPTDFTQQYAQAAEQAAGIRYNRGMRWMENSDKQSAKNAYYEFSAALQYRPGSSEIEELKNRAFDIAATYVVVNPATTRSYNYNFTDVAQDLDRNVISYLQSYASGTFVRYYTPWEAQNLSRRPDQVIDLQFADIRQERANVDRTEREVSKDVVIRERVIRPDSIVREYGRVSARIITTRETINTTGTVYLTIRDGGNGYALMDRRVDGMYCFTNESARFTGDERALSAEDKNRLNSTYSTRPSERELAGAISRDIQQKLNTELRYFYNSY